MVRRALLMVLLHLIIISYVSAENTEASESIQDTNLLSEEKKENIPGANNQDKKTVVTNSERFYQIKINLKILDDVKKELVNSDWNLATLSGKAVSINLRGNNLVIKADMTPYYSDKNSILLLIQANVKLKPSDSEVSKFYSTVNSLPIKLGEKALFFPLGLLDEKMENISSCVLEIEVQPYDNIESINGPGSKQLGEKIKKE